MSDNSRLRAVIKEDTNLPEGYQIGIVSLPSGYRLLSGELGTFVPHEQEHIAFIVEPLSWAAIGSLILKGAISGAASSIVGAVINELLGKKIKLDNVIREVTVSFGNLVREAIKENELNKATGKVNHLRSRMEAYARDPVSRHNTLDEMTETASDNVGQLKMLGVPATGAFTIAAALELSLNLEIYRLSKSNGDWATYTQLAVEFHNHISNLHDTLLKSIVSRFSIIWGGEGQIPRGVCYYNYEGQPRFVIAHSAWRADRSVVGTG